MGKNLSDRSDPKYFVPETPADCSPKKGKSG